MRALLLWDDESEIETIDLILNAEDDESSTTVHTDTQAFLNDLQHKPWDVVLLPLSYPSDDEAFATFESVRQRSPDMPILGAWRQGEVMNLARFISAGLSSHLLRDDAGEFLFLLASMLEASVAAAADQRARILADRLKEEVDSVRRLQESVIPQDLPKLGDYQVVARYEPAQIRVIGEKPVTMAGGDYYDIFPLNDDNMVMLVGDASGHGVKACMSIMTMHTLIRMIHGHQYADTAEFVAEVNRRLSTSEIVQGEGGFITLLYSTLDVSTNTVQWTAAGAPMPILQNLATNEVTVMGDEEDGGLPLAIDEDWEYVRCQVVVPPNHRLLIYTDGLDEAFPEGGDEECDQFGIDGIIDTMKSSQHMPLHEAMQKLFDDSLAATQGSGRMDDTSVVLLERS